MPSLFNSSVRKSELVSTRSGVSSSEPTAMISAFTLGKSRETGDFIPLFCRFYDTRKFFEVSFKERRRKVFQIVGQALERRHGIVRKARIFISAFVSKQDTHIGSVIQGSFVKVGGHQSKRGTVMKLQFSIPVYVSPAGVLTAAAWAGG